MPRNLVSTIPLMFMTFTNSWEEAKAPVMVESKRRDMELMTTEIRSIIGLQQGFSTLALSLFGAR